MLVEFSLVNGNRTWRESLDSLRTQLHDPVLVYESDLTYGQHSIILVENKEWLENGFETVLPDGIEPAAVSGLYNLPMIPISWFYDDNNLELWEELGYSGYNSQEKPTV